MAGKRHKEQRKIALAAKPEPARGAAAARALRGFLERHARALALALVALASIRIIATYNVFSNVIDEPAHIACGMEWLDKGVYRWEPQHPPLARVAAALGPYLLGIRSQGTARENDFSMYYEGDAILHRQNYDRTLALARLGILPFFWIACGVVYVWGKRYFGAATAVAALFLFSFLPPVLAHAGLATTDMALTAFLCAALLAGLMWAEEPGARRAVWFGAATGLAVLSKFSTLVFLPAATVAALAAYAIVERPRAGNVWQAIQRRLPTFGLAVLTGAVVIWAGYRFSFGPVAWLHMRLPAPELFQGIQDVMRHNREGHPSYLLGAVSIDGFWDFYFVVLAVKTPLAFLALLGVGTALALRRSSGNRAWMPLACAAGVLCAALFSHINIGVRHILPVYVMFSLVAAVGAMQLLDRAEGRTWAGAALGALVLLLGVSSLLAHPDYIPYFNEIAGSHPENILVDSDLDWGQDLKRLAARFQELGATDAVSVPLSMVDVRKDFGLPRPPNLDEIVSHPARWTALSLTMWKQRHLGLPPEFWNVPIWPDRVPPTEMVGKGMALWHFPEGSGTR